MTEKWLSTVAKTGSYNDLTNKPTSMKNPNALTVQFNGRTNKTYDGGSAQTVNITPADIGASPSNHTHNYAGSSSVGGAATTALECTGNSATATKVGNFTATGTPNTVEKTNLIGMINEVFQSASNGKSAIANAITAKGVSASSSDTFSTLSNKISQITTGIETNDATATASQILSGATAYVNGNKITGTMTNQGAKNSSLNTGQSFTIPEGYHNGTGKITANSLASQTQATANAGQILRGATAYVNGNKITGNMHHLTNESTLQYASDNTTKVITGDAIFINTNTDGVERLSIRYAGDGGYITGNTLFGYPMSDLRNTLGITANKIVSGQTIAGVSGTATIQSLGGLKIATGRVNGTASVSSDTKRRDIYATLPINFTAKIVFIIPRRNGSNGVYLHPTTHALIHGININDLHYQSWSRESYSDGYEWSTTTSVWNGGNRLQICSQYTRSGGMTADASDFTNMEYIAIG